MKQNIIKGFIAMLIFASCNSNKKNFDASGNFEANEVIVSAQQNGELLSYTVNEGQRLQEGAVVGQIDVTIPKLQKKQTEASISALKEKTTTSNEQVNVVKKQLAVQQSQLNHGYNERQRKQNRVKEEAATKKQLEDLKEKIEQ